MPQQRWWDYDDDFLKTKRPFKDKRIVYVLGPPGGLYETSYSLQQKNNCHMTERTHVSKQLYQTFSSLQYYSVHSMSISAVMLDRVLAVAQPILYRKMVHTTKKLEKRLFLYILNQVGLGVIF